MAALFRFRDRFKAHDLRGASFVRCVCGVKFSVVRRPLVIYGSSAAYFKDLRFIRALNCGARHVGVGAKVHFVRGTRLEFRRDRLRSLVTLLLAATRSLICQAIYRFVVRFRRDPLLTRRLRRLANYRYERTFVFALLICHHARGIRRASSKGLRQVLRERGRAFVATVLEARDRRVFSFGDRQAFHCLGDQVTCRREQGNALSKAIKSRGDVGFAFLCT